MGRATFILDRPDFQRFAAVLPDDPERARLERALRKGHDEYHRVQRRRGEIAAAITSVSRELARKSEPELISRMSGLMAEQAVWPMMLAEVTETYGTALAAWARVTWQAFDDVHRDAERALAETASEASQLGRKLERLRIADPEYRQTRAELAQIHETNAPLINTRDLAHRGRGAVQAHLNMVLGGHFIEASVSALDIARFVERHQSRKVAA